MSTLNYESKNNIQKTSATQSGFNGYSLESTRCKRQNYKINISSRTKMQETLISSKQATLYKYIQRRCFTSSLNYEGNYS